MRIRQPFGFVGDPGFAGRGIRQEHPGQRLRFADVEADSPFRPLGPAAHDMHIAFVAPDRTEIAALCCYEAQ